MSSSIAIVILDRVIMFGMWRFIHQLVGKNGTPTPNNCAIAF
ncbi:MAG: hypothetical protein SPH70_04585 [Candidatus Cryptobacteroides sp.]|nr:hypothetical protein [Bacteroidales bacterium]MDY6158339.1 hypothetical protein [Candidatus Cryptobacteroides sp.]